MDLSFLDPYYLYALMAPIPLPEQDDTLQRLALLASAYVLHASAYCFEPSGKRDAAYLSVLTAVFARIWTLHSPSAIAQLFIASNTITFALRTFSNFLITHPDETRRRLKRGADTDVLDEESKWKRFAWGLSYLTNFRGTGWNYHVKGVEHIKGKTEYKTRTSFVVGCAKSIFYSLVFQDVWDTYCNTQPFWTEMGSREGYYSIASGGTEVDVWGILRGAAQSIAGLVSSATGLLVAYNALAAVVMEYSQTFEPYTKFVRRQLNFKHGTALSRYTQLYTAFALSAGVHYLTNRNLPYPKGLPEHKNTPGKGTDQIAFFLLQALIINLEDLVISTYKSYRFQTTQKRVTRHMAEKEPAKVYKYLGYAWVTVWLAATARFYLDEGVIGGGFEDVRPLQFSAAKWVLGNVETGKISFNKIGSSKPDLVW